MTTSRYKGIDLLKLPMAAVVVAIHTTSWKLWGLTSVAVPFFFVVSGFFLFLKMTGERKADLERLRKWTFKALKLYLIWTAVYLPFTVYGCIQDGLSLRQALLLFFRNLVFTGENFLSWPLWYLLGLVWVGAVYYLLRALRLPLWGLIACALAIFAATYFYNPAPDSLFLKFFINKRIFSAFLFMGIGSLAGLLRIPPLTGRLLGWLPDRVALWFRDGSAVIYLTHMIFAGLLIIFLHMEKGGLLFSLSLLGSALAAAVWVGVKEVRGQYEEQNSR